MSAIELRLRADPAVLAEARQALDGVDGMARPGVIDDARLAVSEMVSNSIRHAGLGPTDQIRLRVLVQANSIRIEVDDPGRGFEAPDAEPRSHQTSGWGLYLVQQVSTAWGVEGLADGGTRVWCEIPC